MTILSLDFQTSVRWNIIFCGEINLTQLSIISKQPKDDQLINLSDTTSTTMISSAVSLSFSYTAILLKHQTALSLVPTSNTHTNLPHAGLVFSLCMSSLSWSPPSAVQCHATFLLHHDHWLLSVCWGSDEEDQRKRAASSCLPSSSASPALFPHWIQTWGDDGRKSEREKEREQGNGKMTAVERTEKSLHSQTKQPLSNCWLGLRFSSTPPLHTHAYRVCVCVCGLCPGSSEITRLQLPCVTNADSTAVISPSLRHHLKFFKQRWRGWTTSTCDSF